MLLVWRWQNDICKCLFIYWNCLFNWTTYFRFVIVGSFLDIFNIYDKFILWAGGGALVPITSFGHLLIHGAMDTANDLGVMGLMTGMFDLTASGITSAIVFAFILSLIFKPKD